MPWRCWIDAYEIHRGKCMGVCLSLGVALGNTFRCQYVLARFHPNSERKHIRVGQGGPTSLSLSFHHPPERIFGRRLFRVTPCRKGTIHLQTPMSSPWDSNLGPTTQQSASLTTIPDGLLLKIFIT
ncbi:hypothetical protein TNCV_1548121 [Trichonephila clavipes]|nr:hypothetical protein TNCV_1548121 [Trichonephila clavipes]